MEYLNESTLLMIEIDCAFTESLGSSSGNEPDLGAEIGNLVIGA